MTRDAALLAVALAHGIPPTRLAVVLALLRHALDSTAGLVVNAQQAQVAAEAGVTDRTVRAVVADLVALGMVSERGRCVTFAAGFDPLALAGKPERASGNRNVLPESGTCFRNVLPETGTTIRKPERASGGTDDATHARGSLSEQIMISKKKVVVESKGVREREPAPVRETPAPEAAPAAPPSPPEPMGAQLTPELRAAMGTLDRACGWAFTPAVWVDGIMAATRAHGPEATTSALMSLAEWATGTPGHRRIPRVTWLPERAAQAAQPKAQGRPGAYANPICTDDARWQAAAVSVRSWGAKPPEVDPEELEAFGANL
jgi:hypothetical protein